MAEAKPSIDELVLKYLSLLDTPGMDGDFVSAVNVYVELTKQIGAQEANKQVEQMKQTFALLGVK